MPRSYYASNQLSRAESIQQSINKTHVSQSRRKPRANDAAWQVARLTLETAAQ